MKLALNGAIKPNLVTNVRKRALTNKKQILESKLLIAHDSALNGARKVTNSPMQHGISDELYIYIS